MIITCNLLEGVTTQCCFTSTETERTTRDWGAQDGHLDFHTAPEFCTGGGGGGVVHVLYYVVSLSVRFVVLLMLLSKAIDLCTFVRLDNAYFIM